MGFFTEHKKRLFPNVFPTSQDPETRTKDRGPGPKIEKPDWPTLRKGDPMIFRDRPTKGRVPNRREGKKSCGLVTRDWTGEESYAFARYFFFRVFKAPDPWVCKPTISSPIRSRLVQLADQKIKNETAHVCGIIYLFLVVVVSYQKYDKNS